MAVRRAGRRPRRAKRKRSPRCGTTGKSARPRRCRMDGLPMRRLPSEQWKIQREGELVLVAADEHNGAYWWTRFELADLPNDLLSVDDLKFIGIELLDGRAVVK